MSSEQQSIEVARAQSEAQEPSMGFYALLLAASLLMLYISASYLGMLIMALVIAIVADPIYKFLVKKLKRKVIAAITTSLLLVFVFILPLYLFTIIAVGEMVGFTAGVGAYIAENPDTVIALQSTVENVVPQLDVEKLSSLVFTGVSNFVSNFVVPLVTSAVTFVVNLTFFLLFLIYSFLSKDSLISYVTKILPLGKKRSETFVNQIVASTNTILKSVFVAALAQAVVSIIVYALLGIPALEFWFLAILFTSFLPLGAGLVNVPIAIIVILLGNIWGGLFLLLWHMFVVSTADNVVRARMFTKSTIALPELLTFVSTLGAIVVFGLFGIIYGPLIAMVFVALVEIHRERQQSNEVALETVKSINN